MGAKRVNYGVNNVNNRTIMVNNVNNLVCPLNQAKTLIQLVQSGTNCEDQRNHMCFSVRVHGRPLET